mmetsp:Transcript_13289/g.28854  ORF Transcript_13289/g.28854 Transcript_13289/m.28854 type:complete len:380 (-) Transcript_13289:30-1169(-)
MGISCDPLLSDTCISDGKEERRAPTLFIFDIIDGIWAYLTRFVASMMQLVHQQGKDPPVKVYILLGQSNMLGMGRVVGDKDGTLEYAVHTKHLYPYLVDDDGNWATSQRVRNVRVMGSGDGMKVYHNEFLSVRGDTIGPEIGIGHCLEEAVDGKIMLLKSCIGNRSLGWDLLPPGSKRFEWGDKMYAGYRDSPACWPSNEPKPDPISWYAGKQYDDDVANCKSVLKELDKYYPGASEYEVAGFFWWQGDKDRYDEAYATMYRRNLVALIKQLRVEFDAPDAKLVLATLGQTSMATAKGNEELILNAMLAVDGNSGEYPDFLGNVATCYSHPLSKGGSSNGHYNGNAETYMNIGEAMGRAMVEISSGATDERMKSEAVIF